jgi:hypothetical protein
VGLQRALPGARVVYCSATGASEPRNLGYMERLGLWGAGIPSFTNFQVHLCLWPASVMGWGLQTASLFLPQLVLPCVDDFLWKS